MEYEVRELLERDSSLICRFLQEKLVSGRIGISIHCFGIFISYLI